MSLTEKPLSTGSKGGKTMAYKEMKLNPGEAKDLNALWNSGMTGPKKSGGKKPAEKKNDTTGKKPAGKRKK